MSVTKMLQMSRNVFDTKNKNIVTKISRMSQNVTKMSRNVTLKKKWFGEHNK